MKLYDREEHTVISPIKFNDHAMSVVMRHLEEYILKVRLDESRGSAHVDNRGIFINSFMAVAGYGYIKEEDPHQWKSTIGYRLK